MQRHSNGFFDARIIISLFVIGVGVILLAENLGADIHINVWEWWPLILIFIGLGHFLRPEPQKQIFTALILIGLGLVFLSNTLDIFYFNIGDLWPVILIIIGLAMIRNHSWKSSKEPLSQDALNFSMVMGGGEYRFSSKKFKGGKVTAFLGGGTLDLTEAEMEAGEVEIDIFTMMGGLEIRIPKHWQLNVQATPLMGGVEDKTYTRQSDGSGLDSPHSGKKLTITGTIIMGGLEVRN